jgi:hypothetical protein
MVSVPRGSRPSMQTADAHHFWRLPRRKVDRLLASTRRADRIELKLVVPESAHESVCAALKVDFARAAVRTVYYLDTSDLKLSRNGVVARVRSHENRPDDSVVKLRPYQPGDLPARLRRSKHFSVEVDAMPGKFVLTGAMFQRLGKQDAEETLREGGPRRALFSAEQRALFPAGVRVGDLSIFGPVAVRREKVQPQGADFRLAVERWVYPDGSSILELSTRCAARAAIPTAAQLASVLRAYEIDLTGPQQTKTRATLAYFGGDR